MSLSTAIIAIPQCYNSPCDWILVDLDTICALCFLRDMHLVHPNWVLMNIKTCRQGSTVLTPTQTEKGPVLVKEGYPWIRKYRPIEQRERIYKNSQLYTFLFFCYCAGVLQLSCIVVFGKCRRQNRWHNAATSAESNMRAQTGEFCTPRYELLHQIAVSVEYVRYLQSTPRKVTRDKIFLLSALGARACNGICLVLVNFAARDPGLLSQLHPNQYKFGKRPVLTGAQIWDPPYMVEMPEKKGTTSQLVFGIVMAIIQLASSNSGLKMCTARTNYLNVERGEPEVIHIENVLSIKRGSLAPQPTASQGIKQVNVFLALDCYQAIRDSGHRIWVMHEHL
ncbi:hypothetical protein Pelo_6466 [Pelomyxa schiedti]|nr:hypothetical protein Pelo_6466 [Pelomyxa schiedti]